MTSLGPPIDHFPSTHRTWIEQHLTIISEEPSSASAHDAHRTLCAFVMSRYQGALCAYVSATGLRDLGEPQELVASFFARALDTPMMMQRWMISGVTLRRWLMNAISLHCRGLRRDRVRSSARMKSESDFADPNALAKMAESTNDPSPERAFDIAWAIAVANEAHEAAHAACIARDRSGDYEVFRLHVIDGIEHAQVAERLGITRSQSMNAVRRVADMMRGEVRELLRAEGVQASDLDEAVTELIALSSRRSQ